jgi:hypothetical protein
MLLIFLLSKFTSVCNNESGFFSFFCKFGAYPREATLWCPTGAATLSLMGLVVTLSIDIRQNSIVCHYAECRDYLNLMLSVVTPPHRGAGSWPYPKTLD